MKQQHVHFIVLIGILITGATAYVMLIGNKEMQIFIGILTSLAYVVWGLLHHGFRGNLHPKVVIEYVLIAVIAVILILLLGT